MSGNEWIGNAGLGALLGGMQSGSGGYTSGTYSNFIVQQMRQSYPAQVYASPVPPPAPQHRPNLDWLDKRINEMRVKL